VDLMRALLVEGHRAPVAPRLCDPVPSTGSERLRSGRAALLHWHRGSLDCAARHQPSLKRDAASARNKETRTMTSRHCLAAAALIAAGFGARG
jgi:hypothetical protein